MRSSRLALLSSPLVAAAFLIACSGDGGGTIGNSPDDASNGDANDATVATKDGTAEGDAGASTDASDAAPASDAADAGVDTGPPPFDAGSPVWTLGPPADGGTDTKGASVGDASCTFTLGVITSGSVGPPTYYLYLEKTDTTPGSCNEPKGYVELVASLDYAPAAFLAKVTGEELLSVTYDYKQGLSGSSPVFASLAQVDWYSGIVLHRGAFGLTGSDAGGPPGPGKGSTFVSALSFTGHDAVVTGSGYFPGAPNDNFIATYKQFVATEYQAESLADSVQ